MNKKLFVATVLFVFVGFAGLVFAEEDDSSETTTKDEMKAQIKQGFEEKKKELDDKKEVREEQKEERFQIREERQKKLCENIEKRIKTRINRYENNHNRHVKILNNLESRLERLTTIFEEKSLDVSQLQTDTATLSAMIDDVVATHETFISELKETEKQACGESEGQFKNQLGVARKVLPEVKEGIEEVRDFYKDTIRPEIIDLRNQLEDESEDETEEE